MRQWMWVSAGVGLLMAAGVAVAQVPPTGAPPPPAADMQQPPGGPMGGRMGGMHGPMGGMHGPMDGMHRRMGWMMMHRMGWHHPAPSKAAHFRFKKGDAVVDIKCADDEPTKACVDAGSALLDKLMAAPK